MTTPIKEAWSRLAEQFIKGGQPFRDPLERTKCERCHMLGIAWLMATVDKLLDDDMPQDEAAAFLNAINAELQADLETMIEKQK